MSQGKWRELRSAFLAFLGFCAATAFVAGGVFSYGNPQSQRLIEDKIPKHLPIKIKIQAEKEKAAKDLNNSRWLHDIAFEVKNTGDKPIYYLRFILDMPEITDNGISLSAILDYGERSMFAEWKGIATPEDKPILPNETVILKIPELQANGWDERAAIEKLPQPKKLSIIFIELNFGDGTGFYGEDGRPKAASRKNEQTRYQNLGGGLPNHRLCNHAQAITSPKSRLDHLIGGGSASFWATSFHAANWGRGRAAIAK